MDACELTRNEFLHSYFQRIFPKLQVMFFNFQSLRAGIFQEHLSVAAFKLQMIPGFLVGLQLSFVSSVSHDNMKQHKRFIF